MVSLLRRPAVTLALVVLVLAEAGFAFLPSRSTRSATKTTRGASNSKSTTMALSIFNFFNEGKKIVVKKLAGEYDEVAIKDRLDGLVSDNKVLMLSFTTCPFCAKAKGILDSKPSVKYTVVELDQDADGKAIRAVMGDTLGRTSVPAVWIDGKFIGGCNDGPLGGGIVQLEENGELDTMLRAAKAM